MLYIHIPFCHSKCIYCDFYSMPGAENRMERYTEAIVSELDMRRNEIDKEFSTIYIGGGTPSVLPRELSVKLFNRIAERVHVDTLEEFTVEVNPEDVTRDLLNFYIDHGVNRISMGIQSFNDTELKIINRRHSSDDAVKAIELIAESGLSFSCDLIYGLPEQSVESWYASLTRLLYYDPGHFSSYLLSYEPGTRLNAMRSKGIVKEASEETITEMYSILCDEASRRGYDHYEISNFGKPDRHAIHNSRYWNGTPYLGLGASAHSFDGKLRRYNPLNVNSYMQQIEEGKVAYIIEQETDDEQFNDLIITSLRTSDGLNLSTLPERRQRYLTPIIKQLINRGAILQNGTNIYIPEDKWLIADDIMRRLIIAD